ncbi:hypothetical protein [Candidatus Nitrospira neomarina]|uniref:Uncharacterized protein n=1 Tax=Candidatus Nitrospira neomarina TaxID=3020899 RepID=A0AA96GQU6_9BACT|nr:hypothetical protein [Candidatus Nitrospira neomarina]WNM61886.1 hypothetical protein PQG83_19405 [Candidatus Nitrospira neomarina]
MGLLKKLRGMFNRRKTISTNPLYEIVLTYVQTDMHESPYEFIQKISEASKKKILQEIYHVTETLWQAPDRVLANREGLLESMLHQVDCEIFIIEPGHKLAGFNGISGELKDFLPEFAQKRIDTGELDWKQKTSPTKDEAYKLVWGKWLRANQYCKIFNEIRLYLKDYHTNQERDWFFPLQCASAAFTEYNFRKEYGLTQIIDGARALQYGSFLEIVSKGHKDPLEEWEKTYHESFPLHSSSYAESRNGKD